MKKIARLEDKLATLRYKLLNTTDPDQLESLNERISDLQDEIEELEDAEQEARDYDELTGNTSQDRYIEQNRYAIIQSERYDQFRSEY